MILWLLYVAALILLVHGRHQDACDRSEWEIGRRYDRALWAAQDDNDMDRWIELLTAACLFEQSRNGTTRGRA